MTPDALPGIDAAVVSGTDSQSNVVVLRDASAATDVNFNISGFGGKLTVDKLGGVVVSNADGSWDGRISAPWAYDAQGRALPISFTVNGNTITQHVDTRGAAFPVVADPHYTWGWVTGTVYFNRHETQIIAANAGWVDLVAPLAPEPFGTLLSAYAAYISEVASNADSVGLCVKVKSTAAVGVYGGTDGDGYCR